MSGGARQLVYKIFVGNLPWTIGSMELRGFGLKFGRVVNSSVIFDKSTGMSKGFGFISYAEKEAFDAALKAGSDPQLTMLEGNTVVIQPTQSNRSSVIN